VAGNGGPQVDAPGVPPEVDGPGRTDLSARLGKLSDRHPSSPDYADLSPRSPGQRPDADNRASNDGADKAWRRAVDRFTSDWQRHQERWAHPGDKVERKTLDPEAERELAGACDRIRAAEPQITDRLRAIEVDQPDRALVGLEYRLKNDERVKQKAATYLRTTPGFSPDQAVAMVPDPIRYTFVYPSDGYCKGVGSDVAQLKTAGFDLLKLKNYWGDPEYKGVNSQWRDQQTGMRFEVQFHTVTSFEAKQLTHGPYERLREPASVTDRREFEELRRMQGSLVGEVTQPPGATDIQDHN
jgi:hypothetical protein